MPRKMKPIVFPAKGRDQKKGDEKFTTIMMDGDTYDDERAEMGKADEEEEKGNGTSKMGEQNAANADSIVLLPEGRESLADGEMVGRKEEIIGQTTNGGGSSENEEEEEGEWPVVDGQTGDDGNKGEQRERMGGQPPRAKIFGKFA